MNINRSLSKLFASFLVGTLLLSSVATAIAATTDTPDWLLETQDEAFLDTSFVPLTPEERAAQRALAEQKAAEKAAAQAEADRLAAEKAAAEAAAEPTVAKPQVTEQTPAETTTTDQTTTSETPSETTTESATSEAPVSTATNEQTSGSQSSDAGTSSESGSSTETVVPAGTYTLEARDTMITSLTEELANSGGSFEVNLGGGKIATVTSEEEARKLLQIAATTGQTTNDFNGNGIDDAFEATQGEFSFGEDRKNEVVKEVVYGDIAPGQAAIVAVPEAIADDTAAEQVVGDKPFLKTRVEPRAGEDKSSVQNSELEINVYDKNGRLVASETVTTDENGVATYEPRTALKNGSYSITTTTKTGEVIAEKNITVDATIVPSAPVIGFKDMNPPGSRVTLNFPINGINVVPSINKIQMNPPGSRIQMNPPGSKVQMNPPGSRVVELDYAEVSVLDSNKVSGQEFDIVQYLLKAYIYKFYPYLDPSEKDAVSAAGIEVTQGEVPKVIEGDAAPGTIVYVTWKSIVGYSVVIADAKGKFKAEAPADLAKGNHSVIAFVYDPKNNLVGNATSLLFKK